MEDNFYLHQSIDLIEKKLEWGNSKEWTNYNFKALSEQITSATGISISVTTLKRLFGKAKSKGSYQLATKNAIAIYLGYGNWQQLKSSLTNHSTDSRPPIVNNNPGNGAEKKYGKTIEKIALTAILALGLATIGVIIQTKFKDHKLASIIFSSKNLTGTAPHTVGFHYNISNIEDSVFIYFDESGSTVKSILPQKKSFITQWYQLPDYYKVSVKTKKHTLASLGVNVESRGWARILETNDFYLLAGKSRFSDGVLQVTNDELLEKGIDVKGKYWEHFRNIKDFDVSGDNFVLETRIKNTAENTGLSCADSEIEITGENQLILVSFLQPGCARYAKISIGGSTKYGAYSDLSSLTKLNLYEWQTLRIQVKDGKGAIFANGKKLFQEQYKEKTGTIRGIQFKFLKGGAVDYVKIWNGYKKLVYDEDFD